MIDDNKPLAEQLRSAAESMDGPLLPLSRMYMQLADRVEAYEVDIKRLSAKSEKLREALLDVLVYAPDYMHGMPRKHYDKIALGETK